MSSSLVAANGRVQRRDAPAVAKSRIGRDRLAFLPWVDFGRVVSNLTTDVPAGRFPAPGLDLARCDASSSRRRFRSWQWAPGSGIRTLTVPNERLDDLQRGACLALRAAAFEVRRELLVCAQHLVVAHHMFGGILANASTLQGSAHSGAPPQAARRALIILVSEQLAPGPFRRIRLKSSTASVPCGNIRPADYGSRRASRRALPVDKPAPTAESAGVRR